MADAGSPVAKRSSRVVVKQRERTCRRCAQRVNKDLEPTCDVEDNKKCTYCGGTRHECLELPEKFNSDLNDLYRLARAYCKTVNGTPAEAQAKRALDARQKKFNKELHAYLRTAGRHGAHAKPKSAAELALLQLKQTTRIADALEHMIDLKRHEMKLPNVDPVSEEESEDSDDESSSGSSSSSDDDGAGGSQPPREDDEEMEESSEESESETSSDEDMDENGGEEEFGGFAD